MNFTNFSNFNDGCRMDNDNGTIEQYDIQNNRMNEYLLTNHFANNTQQRNAAVFSNNHTNLHFGGVARSDINEHSKLSRGQIQSREYEKLSLQERPYLTVPYLGRGRVDPELESRMLQGEYYTNRKSSNIQSEVSYIPYSNTPLLDSVRDTIADPANYIESKDSGILLSAMGTRDVNRDKL